LIKSSIALVVPVGPSFFITKIPKKIHKIRGVLESKMVAMDKVEIIWDGLTLTSALASASTTGGVEDLGQPICIEFNVFL
jgi:hypothetical protein